MARFSENDNIDPDEVFFDSSNISATDRARLEGSLERALSKRSVSLIAILFSIVLITYVGKLGILQISKGEAYSVRSKDNNLEHVLVVADRGLIYDRNNELIAWNEIDGARKYIKKGGLAHVSGYVGLPNEVDDNIYSNEKIGITGLEKLYNDTLAGEHGLEILERDVTGEVVSKNIQNLPVPGESIVSSIDSGISSAGYEAIKSTSERLGYVGGAFVMLDIHTGEVVALTSYPEFNQNILSSGEDHESINKYLKDERNPFLNRVTSGLYAPGSTIKPYVAVAALQEGVIDEKTKIESRGSISIPNPFFPELSTIFVEANKTPHGFINVKQALAVSSNVFFYEVSGGYERQRGIGIRVLKDYLEKFGFGKSVGLFSSSEPAGTIPSPEWKSSVFNNEDWHLGDTYNTSIGQYGLLITPIQIARAVGVIASGGNLVEPHLILGDTPIIEKVPINEKYFEPVREGMRLAVLEGTVWRLNFNELHIAGKTGTAEVGVNNKYINSWVTGFFPYENPKYSFALVMERGINTGENGASSAMRDLVSWIIENKLSDL